MSKEVHIYSRYNAAMYYYDVVVLQRMGAYSNTSYFTYQSIELCSIGQVVLVPFGSKTLSAVIMATHTSPVSRKLKTIQSYPHQIVLPKNTLALGQWMSEYYAVHVSTVLASFVPKGISSRTASLIFPDHKTSSTPYNPPSLNSAQRKILRDVSYASGTQVLHGVTGSGKTHIYIELAKQTLSQNKHVLILMPEIALTTQLVEVFSRYFGKQVQIGHSALTNTQRRHLWFLALTGKQPQIWIGTRSNLFLPLKNIGLIVADEFHDQSYKQDTQPRYHGVAVAAQLGKLHNALVVLGSATPSVRDMYIASQKDIPIHQLVHTVHARKSDIQLIDLRRSESKKHFSWLSQELEAVMVSALEQGEQILLFLNRRGNATQLRCTTCGWHMQCPNCNVSLVFHEDEASMRCHTCSYYTSTPTACPTCSSSDLLLKGIGTKEIEKLISQRFPEHNILRFDHDNFSHKELHLTYQQMRDKHFDILIGTQMLAKGFDLPHLSTIGIIDADMMLHFPDFSSTERTFQMLTQVMGRGGRRGQNRIIVLQTFQPEHPIIQAALHEDYNAFYKYELQQRSKAKLPPFRYLLKITSRSTKAGQAERILKKIVQGPHDKPLEFLGPTPAFRSHIGKDVVWQLCALSTSREILRDLAKSLPSTLRVDLDPLDLL